ncbi:MAG: serine/threonine protein kinase, partial [Candidatus Omnitrophica bacterium]|nr:serine/threonine protein kinase [Candidatus Omnitrophota bacterium]
MAGLWVRVGVERAINNELAAHLQSVLSAEVNALRVWFKEKESDVKTLALDAQIQAGIAELVERNRDGKASPAELSGSPAAKELRLCLRQRLEPQGYSDFIVVDKKGKRILASFEERLIGRREPDAYGEYVHRTFRGYSTATRPFPSEVPLPDAAGIPHAEVPTMFVMAPVRNTNGVIIAALALRMQPEEEFDKLFSIGHMGESGETYAFDRDGLMLTRGRFESELKSLGLLPDQQDDSPVLRLRLLDPGVDLRKSKPSSRPNHDLGLTKMAAEATRGRSGFDTHGYRDYRGVPVMGAWTWLPDYRMGIATEVSVQEAYEPLYVLRQAFLAMFFLLVLTFIALFGFSLRVRQLQAAARKSALTARRLGQYALLQDIGAGGNGRVYKARHAMLRRPVAVKLLNPEFMDETTVARFQREVQATSQLTHPNTVAIYDYGRTPEGVFYYAMEFLGGFNLDKLVKRFGPQPEGRVICILQQVCGSLSEAHTLGLIHRDIKPANILL